MQRKSRTWANTYNNHVEAFASGELTWDDGIKQIQDLWAYAVGAVEHFDQRAWARECLNLADAVKQAMWDLSDDAARKLLMAPAPVL